MRATSDHPTGFTATAELNLLFGHTEMRHFRLSLATVAQKPPILFVCFHTQGDEDLIAVYPRSARIAAELLGVLTADWKTLGPALEGGREFHRRAAPAASRATCPLRFWSRESCIMTLLRSTALKVPATRSFLPST